MFCLFLSTLILIYEFSRVEVSNAGKNSLGSFLTPLVLLPSYPPSHSTHLSHPPHPLIRDGTYDQNVLPRSRKCDAESLGFEVVCDDGGDKFETVLLSEGLTIETALQES